MLDDVVVREYNRQTNEAYNAVLCKRAMENAGKFGDFFTKRQSALVNAYVPGYQREVISPTRVLASVTPEDPLFCRVEEMSIKYFGITGEAIIGAIEGSMQQQASGESTPEYVSDVNDMTEADKCLRRGVDLLSVDVANAICAESVKTLMSSGLVNFSDVDLNSQKLTYFQPRLPQKRLANRRASAGVQMNLGVRRKSVVPLS